LTISRAVRNADSVRFVAIRRFRFGQERASGPQKAVPRERQLRASDPAAMQAIGSISSQLGIP
jgi:hypothetical protein